MKKYQTLNNRTNKLSPLKGGSRGVIALFLLLFPLLTFSQVRPIREYKIQNDTVAFGKNISAGTYVYNLGDSIPYQLNSSASSSASLNSTADKTSFVTDKFITIDASDRFGFFTSTPYYDLDVNGTFRVTGSFIANDQIATNKIIQDRNKNDILILGDDATGVEIQLYGTIDVKDTLILSKTITPPATAAATGTKGMIVLDADYIYICTATDTWKRTAISTW